MMNHLIPPIKLPSFPPLRHGRAMLVRLPLSSFRIPILFYLCMHFIVFHCLIIKKNFAIAFILIRLFFVCFFLAIVVNIVSNILECIGKHSFSYECKRMSMLSKHSYVFFTVFTSTFLP